MDFSNAQLPRLTPLDRSFTENAVEADCKRLLLDLFNARLATQAFDANVLGAAHLGSLDLVRKAVNTDGLVLLQGDREEAATRYLYRAWKSGDVQGRGLHFLRTYLQLLFPNECEVEQLWHDKAQPYPTALYTNKPSQAWWLRQLGEPGLKLNGSWGLGRRVLGADASRSTRTIDTAGMYLTSRIRVSLDFGVDTRSVASLIQIIRAVIPARLLPEFRFWLRLLLDVEWQLDWALVMDKSIPLAYPWCGRVVTDAPERRWKLGSYGNPAKLPQPFGSFKLGRLLGATVPWRLKSCRITGAVQADIAGSAWAWRVETIPPNPVETIPPVAPPAKLFNRVRKLDGTWRLGGARRINGSWKLAAPNWLNRPRKMSHCQRFGTFKISNYTPGVLVPAKPARLTLSGAWKLGGARNPVVQFEKLPKIN